MSRRKRILLLDAVVWSPAYPAQHPLRDVGGWFGRHFASLPDVQLNVVNAEADLSPALKEAQGVIISGSPRDAWTDDPINTKLCGVALACRDRNVPVLGVCFGHQILGRALGGVVARHPQGLEIGDTTVELTPTGRSSPLFASVPDRFEVLSSHADAVLQLPAHCELLVKGAFTPVQAFQSGDRLFGVQFHPEQDPESLRFLWSVRREAWRSKVSFDLDRALDQMHATPMGGQILRNFAQQIVL